MANAVTLPESFEKDWCTGLPDQVSEADSSSQTCILTMLVIASDNASPEDMLHLADNLGIRTVIDLRTK